MPIKENQLDVWSKQGSITQSATTYGTVRTVLEANDAPYKSKAYYIFLQGSYGNDTNIYADSDVDVVIRLDSTYYHNSNDLPSDQQTAFNSAASNASYSYNDFKTDVTNQLVKNFGSSVVPGNKAIYIKGNGARRDSDVVVAAQYKKYTYFYSSTNQNYIEGICFWTSKGNMIINYPKQHSDNCTQKHQATSNWFKPMVRILKNMRNTMIEKGYLAEGVAPSYFLEGMLYNVPNENFGRTYADTFVKCINWLKNCENSKLLCANEQYYLLHPTSLVTWREEKMNEYLNKVSSFWTNF